MDAETVALAKAISDDLARFRRHLAHERRLSARTIDAYFRDITCLTGFMQAESIEQWNALDAQHLRTILAERHRSGLQPRSVQRLLSSMRALFRWLILEDILQADPSSGVRAPKTGKPLPKTMDVDLVSALLDSAEQDPLLIRDQAMFELFYGAGLRLSELTTLDRASLSLNDRSLRVLGKGNKERILPIAGKAVTALEAWLSIRPQFASKGETALFVSKNGNRISNRSVQARLERWSKHSGIGRHVHPHMLRHSYATHVLESSGNLRAVQELLGHENLGTTQIYTSVDFQHLAKVYDKAHPRAGGKKTS